ncbi:head-tail connector protein [Bacillus capparidis]|uniref:Phage protein (Predicted DNA packaging) n=1 Tax=Bacillus capparidis TaxID=1840411 RepID=A0ABS4D1K3_9BACI|nr:head-tail connector protein [Bacillus capparidis]MBP1083501.1 putative phage protein (predicted DNA packaging) [Bacillus capparidis]MED1094700.1 head-tail connector protein [Bacillus capparidis]
MIITVNEAKRYLRIEEDFTEDNEDVGALISAAEKYLKNAGCMLNPDDEMAKLAVKMLTIHWYENREPIGKGNKLAFGLQSLITQLQHCYEEGEPST